MPKAKRATNVAATASRAGIVGRARNEAQALVRDAQRVGARVQKTAEKVVADFERRAEKVISLLEVRAVKAVEPALKKEFATRRELREMRAVLDRLAGQVGELARRLD